MDQSYTRQSKLIKAINVAVWAVLFLAGAILCQRVFSEQRSVQNVNVASTSGGGDSEAAASQVVENLPKSTEQSETTEQSEGNEPSIGDEATTSETQVVEVTDTTPVTAAPPAVEQTPEPIEVAVKNEPRFQPPPRRVSQQKTRKVKPRPKRSTTTKPPVLATSPITSHTTTKDSHNGTLKASKTDIDVTPSTPEVTKSLPQQVNPANSIDKAPTRIQDKLPKSSSTVSTAQSSINVATSKTVEVVSTTTPQPAITPSAKTTKTVTTPPKTATKTVRITEPKTATKTATTTTPKAAKDSTPALNPRHLLIENPKKIGYPVSFIFGDQQQTLQPGGKLTRVLDSTSSIANVRFDRGGDFGEAILNLKPGTYEFKVTREGWNIVPQVLKSK